jgi:hypothetical protein
MRSGGLARAFVAPCAVSLVLAWAIRPASARHADDDAGRALANESPGPERTPSSAAIVLVGELREGEQLVLLLRELLGRQGVECDFSETARFDPDALFAEGEADGKVRVFVRLADAGRARLYFRGPSGERFLLRTIALPSGLDEVGRELVGQVVESSVVTLLRSSNGLSRDEASAELARETGTPEKPPLPPAAPPQEKPETLRAPLTFSVALRYAAEWFGPDLELAHGPGLELGVGTRGAVRLRARVSGEWFFDQTLETPELRAEVGTKPLRASVDVGLELAEKQVVTFGIGGGVDLSRVEPSTSRADNVTPSEPQSNVVPVLRPELRYELGTASLVVGASAFVDVSLVHTHYDLLDDGEPVRLGAPWTARPGGALAIGAAW